MKIEHTPDGVEVTLSRRNLTALLNGLDYEPYPAQPSLLKFSREYGVVKFLRVRAQENEQHYPRCVQDMDCGGCDNGECCGACPCCDPSGLAPSWGHGASNST